MFDYQGYWDRRHQTLSEMQAVGHCGKSDNENHKLYGEKTKVIEKLILTMDVDIRDCHVLEIGCGNGYWAKFLRDIGVKKYLGFDVSETATMKAQEKIPEYTFMVGGIDTFPKIDADIILCIDVLQHLVDYEVYRMAIEYLQRAKEYAIATTNQYYEERSNYEVCRSITSNDIGLQVSRVPFNDKMIGLWRTRNGNHR